MPKALLTIEYDGSLADSLRDPTAYYTIHNDGAVHRVDIDVLETANVKD